MLRDEGVVVESTWAVMDAVAGTDSLLRASESGASSRREAPDVREIDRQLRRIAKRRAGLDIEEAKWLRAAENQRIWRQLGYSTALEYLEEVFGYAPRTAMERLRVAKALGDLPALEAAVRDGELPYSAARELTRVMTPDTEAAWLANARGKNLRDIEELVAGRKKGDTPDADKNPELVKRKRVFELSPRVDALVEQCRAVLANELGSHVDDEVLAEALCRCFLAGGGVQASADASEGARVQNGKAAKARAKAPPPAHRIVVYKCESCERAWQQGRGRTVELTPDEIAFVECDDETVRPTDERYPQRATSNIPQRIRNVVWARDRGRCRVPGCRATRCLDIHHIHPRCEGGDHGPSNLVVLCSGHHKLHHAGLLSITGRAPDQLVFMRDGSVLVDARSPTHANVSDALRQRAANSRLAVVTNREHAKQALVQLGYKARVAGSAIDEVIAHVGGDADVGTIVQAALARGAAPCPADDENPVELARQALVQLGFSSAIASEAVQRATAHVATPVELTSLIKEALRWCK